MIKVMIVQIPVPIPTPAIGLELVGANKPNPSAAVSRLRTVNTAAALTAPAIIEPQERFLPAWIGLVSCS